MLPHATDDTVAHRACLLVRDGAIQFTDLEVKRDTFRPGWQRWAIILPNELESRQVAAGKSTQQGLDSGYRLFTGGHDGEIKAAGGEATDWLIAKWLRSRQPFGQEQIDVKDKGASLDFLRFE